VSLCSQIFNPHCCSSSSSSGAGEGCRAPSSLSAPANRIRRHPLLLTALFTKR
jgi:hypothetical protein